MSGGFTFRNKTNTFRLLQQEIVRSYESNRVRHKYLGIINQANILILLIALLATYGTIDLAAKTNSLWIAYITLAVQTLAVIIFFATKKYDWFTIRLLLVSYIAFYAIVLLRGDGLAVAPYWMFTYILFAFVGAGAKEGFIWIGLQFSVLCSAIYIDQQDSSPLLPEAYVSILIIAYILVAAFAYLMDYTARLISARVVEQNHQIEEANARYDIILNNIGEALLATDENGDIEFVNSKATKLLSLQRNQILGENYKNIVVLEKNGESINHRDHPISTVLASSKPYENGANDKDKYRILLNSGKAFTVTMTITPVQVFGVTQGAIFLFKDASVEEQINKSKNEFVSLASHQLRTPLNIANWYLEKILSEKKGKLNKKQREYLEDLKENNSRMSSLVADLLTVSRLELGKTNKKSEEVELSKLIVTIAKEIGPIVEEKNLNLKIVDYCKYALLKHSDGSLATVIVQNLLTNAAKYTLEDGEIFITLRSVKAHEQLNSAQKLVSESPGFVLSVKDSGIGIPADQQEKIFSKLYRADNAQQVDVSGTGLGLYVTQSFAHELGGFVWFISEKNKGSEFSVYLPTNNKVVA
jgi:signal transduction histidine kinase